MDFIWLGNHPAPDLCNTTPVINGVEVDLLSDADSIGAWAREAGIRPDSPLLRGAQSHQVVQFVHRLRRALRAALETGRLTPDHVAGVNAPLSSVAGRLTLKPGDPDPVALRASTDSDQLCLDIGHAVLDIFRHDRTRIRRCANPQCVLLFLDVSKSGQRRWCDMGTCGNRAKASAHYARRRQ